MKDYNIKTKLFTLENLKILVNSFYVHKYLRKTRTMKYISMPEKILGICENEQSSLT